MGGGWFLLSEGGGGLVAFKGLESWTVSFIFGV